MAGQTLRVVAGSFALVNAIPHGWHAVRRRPFPSPFSSPPGRALSPPVHNAIWSALNAAAAAALLRGRITTPRDRLVAASTATGTAVLLISYFRPIMARLTRERA